MGRKRLTLVTERGPVSMLPRILCAVVVDVSASTFASGALDAMIAALPQFRDAVLKDSLLTRKLSWAIVAFSDTTQVLFPYGPVTEWVPPEALEHGNGTAMATAILETIRLQAEHVEYLGEQGIPVQHKLVFLVTDAYANNEPPERLDEAAELIAEAEKNDFSFFGIGVENADMNVLRRLNPRRTPLRLAEVKDFAKYFAWLNMSLRTVSMSQPGELIKLPDPMKTKPRKENNGKQTEPENPIGWGEI
jgi:uncharacterized protein YegL